MYLEYLAFSVSNTQIVYHLLQSIKTSRCRGPVRMEDSIICLESADYCRCYNGYHSPSPGMYSEFISFKCYLTQMRGIEGIVKGKTR